MSSPAASPPDVGVVMVAAGVGVRAGPGEPKQFRAILGVPMLLRALRPFTSHPEVVQVVVALPAADADHPPEWLAKLCGERLALIAGGELRAHSVRAGLRALSPAAAVVLVHDAARPFVSRTTIDAVIARARGGGRGGGSPGQRHGEGSPRWESGGADCAARAAVACADTPGIPARHDHRGVRAVVGRRPGSYG